MGRGRRRKGPNHTTPDRSTPRTNFPCPTKPGPLQSMCRCSVLLYGFRFFQLLDLREKVLHHLVELWQIVLEVVHITHDARESRPDGRTYLGEFTFAFGD